MSRILVIGATGNIGSQVLAQLSAAGAPVRALARNPESAELPNGVDVVRGDITLPDTLDSALDSIDTVFLVWIAPPETVGPALDRILHRARRIVFLSAPLKTNHPLFQQPNPSRLLHEQIERIIENSGRDFTFLRPGMLNSNAIRWWAPQFRAGDLIRWPYLDLPTAPIDERDIAAVAVRALCEPGHARAEYVLTGPQSLTHSEQIATIARMLGRSVRVEEISPADAPRELLPVIPGPALKMLLDAWNAGVGHPAFQTTTVEEITGAPARTFFAWATERAAEFARSNP